MQILMKKDLKKKKLILIEIDSKYFETEKLSNEDLEEAKKNLKKNKKLLMKLLTILLKEQ